MAKTKKSKVPKIKIKNAKKGDFDKIIDLVKELAAFEKLEGPDELALQRLYKDTFGKKRLINMLVAKEGKDILGYAIYFESYSSFLAKKTLFLEDIFITQSRRNTGIGKFFFDRLIEIANDKGCGRVEWAVLDWNIDAIAFYNKIGATPLSNWEYYRLTL